MSYLLSTPWIKGARMEWVTVYITRYPLSKIFSAIDNNLLKLTVEAQIFDV